MARRDGLTGTGAQSWSQASPGIAGIAEKGDAFGTHLAAGDFTGDGRDDLAIGVPLEILTDPAVLSGVVEVLLGAPAGLTSTGSQLWTSGMAGLGGTAAGGFFGAGLYAIRTGTGAGVDLLIGVPAERYNGDSDTHEGTVYDLPGTPTGPTLTGHHVWRLDGSGSIHGTTDLAGFGGAIA